VLAERKMADHDVAMLTWTSTSK